MDVVAQVVEYLGLDPFVYLVVVISSLVFWIYANAVADFALAGVGMWMRRGALLVASLGVLFFAYAVRGSM